MPQNQRRRNVESEPATMPTVSHMTRSSSADAAYLEPVYLSTQEETQLNEGILPDSKLLMPQ